MKKKNLNFLLYGQGSYLNKGCEAIVTTTAKKIKQVTGRKVTVATHDLENDLKYHNDIVDKYVKGYYEIEELSEEEQKQIEDFYKIEFDYDNFEKIREKDVIKEIENNDICLSVGGDNYSYGAENWLYTLNKEIKSQNKKNIFWGTSIFESIENDEMIRDLKTFDIIIPRETLTYNALSKFIEKDRLILAPDMAFSLEKQEVELPEIFNSGKKVVGINISPVVIKLEKEENTTLKSVQILIDKILKETNYNIILLPHVYIKGNNDLDALRAIKQLYPDENRVAILEEHKKYNCNELKYIISNCSFLIAARTHASIAGYSSIVPTLVIGYSVKSKGIALDLFGNWEDYVLPIEEITPENLLQRFWFIVNNEKKIRNTLTEKMEIYKKQTDELLNKVLERLDYLEKKQITSNNKCTGCMACFNICPVNAIDIIENEEGFLYPKVNEEKCIHCNKCKEICPQNKSYKYMYEKVECYAAISNNDSTREKSSSGGLFYVIAKKVLEEKGIVYGVKGGKEVKHIRIDKMEDLPKTFGSKYVQSTINNIYTQVKQDLEQNKKVLFSGTPCQIEGLRSFLEKKYENLICVSIICHGVPSTGVYEKYINEKENKVTAVNFRDKTSGWKNYSVTYDFENRKESIEHSKDIYMIGFLSNYFLRETCYNCQMKYGKKFTGDIILGDFWGIENVNLEMDDNKGTSAIIINSDIGKKVFEEIKSEIKYEKCNIEDVLKYNSAIEKSAKYTKGRERFFKLIKNNNVDSAIKIIKFDESNEKIQEMEKDIATLNNQLRDLLEAKEYFLGQIEIRDNQIQEKTQENQELRNNLDKIQSSRRWRYINKIANLIKNNE